jgi:hypothetical protein
MSSGISTSLDVLAGLAGEREGLLLHEVDDALEFALLAHRELDGDGLGAEALVDGRERHVEVAAGLVHFVHERDARHVVLVCLAPHRLGLGLHALGTVEYHHASVEDAQRALHFGREVHVAGSVDEVDRDVLGLGTFSRHRRVPVALRGGGRDRDAALLLLLHPVHGRFALVHFADLIVLTRVEEDALGTSSSCLRRCAR